MKLPIGIPSLIVHSGIQSWSCSALPLGGGTVQTAHGRLPVPAPATLELLKGLHVFDDGITGERVTPKGAAIVRYLLGHFGASPTDANGSNTGSIQRLPTQSAAITAHHTQIPAGLIECQGSGCGTKRFESMPNIVRASIVTLCYDELAQTSSSGNRVTRAGVLSGVIGVIEFEIDDMTGEELAQSLEHLRAQAAVLDVNQGIRQGKKGRAQFTVRLLVELAAQRAIASECLQVTSTLGVRLSQCERLLLPREIKTVRVRDTPFRVKTSTRPAGNTTHKVESDDLSNTPEVSKRRALSEEVSQSLQPTEDEGSGQDYTEITHQPNHSDGDDASH